MAGSLTTCVTIEQNRSLAELTRLRVGGPAALFAEPAGVDELIELIGLARLRGWEMNWIGGGANVLIHDRGVDGLVIRLAGKMNNVVVTGDEVIAEAGAMLPGLVARCGQQGLVDLTALTGIPGTCGGAVHMNAGTLHGTIADKLAWIETIDPVTGQTERRKPSDMGFSYRTSRLQHEPGIVIRIAFRREAGLDREDVWRRICGQVVARTQRQPGDAHSAGSFFRNPSGHKAGALIEQAGLKGMRIGGAIVSKRHANFLINTGGASSKDFTDLARQIRHAVHQRFGVKLQLEVRLLGFTAEEQAELGVAGFQAPVRGSAGEMSADSCAACSCGGPG